MSNEAQKLIPAMTGYKATDEHMKCRDVQFVLGEWQEVEESLVECKHGFHFCEQPSGPWAFYSAKSTHIFKALRAAIAKAEGDTA